MTELLWILAVLLVAVGMAGIVLPALPGTMLIFAGLLLGAWADGFARVGITSLVVIGVVGAASYLVDFIAAAWGTRRLGASRRGMIGAALGTVLGLFFGLPGILLGPFVGAVIGELTAHTDLRRAGRAGVAAWIGFAVGTAVKVAMAFLMIGIFLGAYFY
jgi:uncharacterized protein YqgC (DUF456 family)